MGKTGKTALVTGASAGLGVEFSRLFAADGHDLILVARRRDKLEALAAELEKAHGVRAAVLAEDLIDRAAPDRIAGWLAERGAGVEFLVNNAGFGTTGVFADLDVERELSLLQVNVTALVHLTRLLLPSMVARKSGRILNVGSTAGFQPGPFMANYYASKAFVNSFTEALSFELGGTGVTATLLCPGATHTEFAGVAGNDKSALFRAGAMNASDVAAQAYRDMMKGRTIVIPGWRNKLGLQSLRVAPRAMVRKVAAALNRTEGPRSLSAR
ncbi:MAG TPA: SDR family oxidoreductase [Polyangiaceae bacterium]|nr:SDR family oxidoreductase [Polyangiaceae bacterium]